MSDRDLRGDLRERLTRILAAARVVTYTRDGVDEADGQPYRSVCVRSDEQAAEYTAGVLLRELDSEFLDFGAWLSEELTGTPMSRIDLESCLEDWKVVEPLPSGCNPHPDAPHGFDRNASHNQDRYVCNCEGWSPDE